MHSGIPTQIVAILTTCTPDATNPLITCPSDTTLPADATCSGILPDYTGGGTAFDACDPAPVLTQNPVIGTNVGSKGTAATVFIIATDASGNAGLLLLCNNCN